VAGCNIVPVEAELRTTTFSKLTRVLRAEHLPRRYRTLVLAGLLLIAASRSPYLLLHGRFWAEEGTEYFAHMKHGNVWFVPRPIGYIHAFCNAATWFAARVPLEQAPLVTAWLSLGVIALLVWTALGLPSELLPNAAARVAAATLLVVGPVAVPVVWLNSVNAQAYLGVLAVLLLFVDVDTLRRAKFVAIAAMLGLAGLSGLYAAVLAPLFLFRALRDRTPRRWVLAGINLLCALAQLVVVQMSRAAGDLAQGRFTFRGWGVTTRDVAAWHFSNFLFGNSIATRLHAHANTFAGLLALALFAAVVAAVLASVLAVVPRPQVALLLVAAFALEELLVIVGTRRGIGGRYVVLPVAILLLISVHAMTTARRRWAVGAASGLCLVALVSGCSVFWTAQPSLLRCVRCPQWQQQVRTWRTGRTNALVVWPYSTRWVIILPHHRPDSATESDTSRLAPPAMARRATAPLPPARAISARFISVRKCR
jgi:hypothetical protein